MKQAAHEGLYSLVRQIQFGNLLAGLVRIKGVPNSSLGDRLASPL